MNLWYLCLWRYGYKGLEEKGGSIELMFSVQDSLDLLYFSPAMVAVLLPFVHVNMAFWVVLSLRQILYTLLSRIRKFTGHFLSAALKNALVSQKAVMPAL